MKKTPPRAGLFRQHGAAPAKTPSEMRSLLIELGKSFDEDANQAEAMSYLDHATKVAHALSARQADVDSDQSPSDAAPKWAGEILSRVDTLREQVRSEGKPTWLSARRLMALVRLVMQAQFEFGEAARKYRAGAGASRGGELGGLATGQKRSAASQKRVAAWLDVDRSLDRALSARARAAIIEKKVANTPNQGSSEAIRRHLPKK